jgi:phosphoribosylanthranilate isomerase
MNPLEHIIQIAGVRSLSEARMLAECGATDLGFPLKLAVHAEDMDENGCAAVIAKLPPSVRPVLITYVTDPVEIIALCDHIGVTRVQLHADLPVENIIKLKNLRPNISIIKSLVVRAGGQEALFRAAGMFDPVVDAFLTDTFDPGTGATGATGLVHDWGISRELVKACSKPLILAGGLHPDNVREAIQAVRPAGVDAHSGLEGPDGFKDPGLCRDFVNQARAGFADIDPHM